MKEKLYERITNIIDVGKTIDKQWTEGDILAKLLEESGEFSRAIQIKKGKLKRKQPKDEDFSECADVIICTIDALARVNGLHDAPSTRGEIDTFIDKICDQLKKKTDKWANKLNGNNTSKRK